MIAPVGENQIYCQLLSVNRTNKVRSILRDIKFAFRQLRKSPGFTTVAVLSLALGIGATTLVFSIVDGVLLRPLAFPGSGRIVHVLEADPEKGLKHRNTSPANFVDWRENNTVFEAIAFSAEHSGQTTRRFIYTDGMQAHSLSGRFVSAQFFDVYGLSPHLGRSFTTEEELPGARRLVVISHRLWHQLFQGDPETIGKTVILENDGRHVYEIIGITPEGFREPGADLWVSCAHMTRPMMRRGGAMIHVVGRLKPDMSIEQAQAEMSAMQAVIHQEHGHLGDSYQHLVMGNQITLVPLLEGRVGSVRQSLVVFSGAVLLVLLIACANVANLLFSRNLSRQVDVAVRISLGAGRWHIVRHLLCESLVLSLAGGLAGVLLAVWGLDVIVALGAGSIPRLETVTIDGRVLLFSLAVSLVTGLVFGLGPAWQSSRADLNQALKDGATRVSEGILHLRFRGATTVIQIALALTLLIGAGLLLQSFKRLQGVETGFDTEELLTVEFSMTGAQYDTMEKRRVFLRRVLASLRDVPGVAATCAVTMIPDRGTGWPTPYARLDRPSTPLGQRPRVSVRVLTPDYLKTYGIRLLRGREFTEADTSAASRAILINTTFAETLFPGQDALGKTIDCGGPAEIIGVIANVKNSGLWGETRPEAYGCFEQWPFQSMFLTVRAAGNPMGLVPVVTRQIRAMNPEQPLNSFRTMQSFLDQATAHPRFLSVLIGLFALTALVLAAVGIYGVMAYSVTQREREMGVRLALGAQKQDLLTLILGHGMRLTLVGVSLGLGASLAANRVLVGLLYGIAPSDAGTFVSVTLLLILVALAACLIPALRATRLNPVDALRYE